MKEEDDEGANEAESTLRQMALAIKYSQGMYSRANRDALPDIQVILPGHRLLQEMWISDL